MIAGIRSATDELSHTAVSLTREMGQLDGSAARASGTAAASAAATLDALTRQAGDCLAQIRSVAAATAEQSQTGASLAGNIEQVAAMVEDTQRAVGQTVGAVRRIDTLSATLKHSVDRFRL